MTNCITSHFVSNSSNSVLMNDKDETIVEEEETIFVALKIYGHIGWLVWKWGSKFNGFKLFICLKNLS